LKFVDEQFVTVALDLFVAGMETTSNSLEFAMLYMILYPEVQQKIQLEIEREVGQSAFPTVIMKNRFQTKRFPFLCKSGSN